MTCIFASLKAGDHVISIDDVYGGTNRLLDKNFGKFNLKSDMIDMTPENLEKAITKDTKLVWIETPTNPLLKLADIEAISKVTKKHGITLCVDNTFATSYLQSPILLGADLVLHSATKYIGGHSDIVGGVVVTNNKELYDKIYFNKYSMGCNNSPFDSYILLRSIKTLGLRMQKQCENARILAHYLESHKMVEKVYYPGLKSHPQHELAKEQMRDFGAMISFVIKADLDQSVKFMKGLKLFILAESLGCVESLIEIPAIMTHASVPPDQRVKLGIVDSLIRISVGVENIEDLLDDLEQGFDLIGK